MTIFFLLIGLELKREVCIGELSNIKEATLPIIGAIGGMVVPGLLYISLNLGTKTHSGFGIPMATDIAFAIGILSLLGNKVPLSLKVFLTALAVIDDIGAIVIIAVFYTKTIYFTNLLISLSIFGVLILIRKLKVKTLFWYLIGGFFMWYFMLHSGVHATITGILLAFAIPFGDGTENTHSYKLQKWIHKPVAFLIIPIFVLNNTAIIIGKDWLSSLSETYSLGIIIGLCIGKPLGILSFIFLAVKLKLTKLPKEFKWSQLIGLGFLGGIGFTMSIFITLLAFDDNQIINNSKFMILIASFFSGGIGFIWLKISNSSKKDLDY